jgi:two-component system, sensor histidine kinase LadS
MKDIFKNISPLSFNTLFSDEQRCLEFLSNEKWRSGYACRKCGHTAYYEGKSPFSRKCSKCKHEESVTAHTVFHHCKIPLKDAFQIGYLVCNNPEISSYEISRILGIRQMTGWKFKKRILECVEGGGKFTAATVQVVTTR